MNIDTPKEVEYGSSAPNRTVLSAAVLAVISAISGCAHESASSSSTVNYNGYGEPQVTCTSSGNSDNARSKTTVNGKTYKCPEN